MDALEFLKTKNRMCEGGCYICPADISHNGYDVGCASLARYYPEEFVAIVTRWGKEHPHISRLDKLKELFPNVEERNGVPNVCPRVIEGKTSRDYNCVRKTCWDCVKEYWEGEYVQK